jgi:hypothetical protein
MIEAATGELAALRFYSMTQHLLKTRARRRCAMFIIGASMAVNSVVCPKAVRLLLHFHDSVVHLRPRLYNFLQIR